MKTDTTTSSTYLLIALLLASMLFASTAVPAGEVTVRKNEQSGLYVWQVVDEGFSLELIQLIPDFVRAVYGKQGFSRAEIERIAGYCLFGSILKNTSNQHMSYRVADWQFRDSKGRLHPVKTKTQWLEEWRKSGITFSWTLLPDVGEFAVGDWQQGFTTIALPHAASFDLIYRWQLDGKPFEGVIENMRCAPEQLPQESEGHE